MMTDDELMQEVIEQENTLHFNEFTSKTALEIGMSIVGRAENEKKVITVDITRHGHQLFHYAFDGTSPDNDDYVKRKINTVNRLNISSLHFRLRLEKNGEKAENLKRLSETEYEFSGGSFPIIIENVGVVGTITVSGLTDTEDHALVVWAIKKYLSK